jgi:hypothetical protein
LRDDEFTKKLFSNLNHDILGSSDDDKIMILSDSDEEEEEVHEEKTTSNETAATSAAVNPTSTTSTDADDAPMEVKMIIVMTAPLISRLTTDNDVGDDAELSCQEGT